MKFKLSTNQTNALFVVCFTIAIAVLAAALGTSLTLLGQGVDLFVDCMADAGNFWRCVQ